MGGSAGRADAAVGAIEAQIAEGVLHIHLYIFFQHVHQFSTLFEIAEFLEKEMLSVDSFKAYINATRVAAYPDIEEFDRAIDSIEQSWPAYSNDYSLSRPSSFLAPRPLHSLPLVVEVCRAMTAAPPGPS